MLGILGVLATPLFGLFTIIPALAAIVGVVSLRTTHLYHLRGRPLALWGFWLGASFFLLDVALVALGIVGMRMDA